MVVYGHIPFSMGLHSVKVWADTMVEAASATAAEERTLENMLTLWSEDIRNRNLQSKAKQLVVRVLD